MQNWETLIKEKEYNDLIMEWNKKINIVSRKKTDVFDLIEDSKLVFDKIAFRPGLKILDLGTGGGFPGIVVAIHHPEADTILVDSIQKKIMVVSDVIKKMHLTNATAVCSRAEELGDEHNQKYDYVVSRSVAVLQDLVKWSARLIKSGGTLITVKGGEIKGEINATRRHKQVKHIELSEAGERKIVVVRLS